MNKKNNKPPSPTGNPWLPSEDDPATVPVPLPVIIVRVEGPYTERDRKLWAFLLHVVWDELGEKPIHELPVNKVNQVFRNLGGEHDSTWIWESSRRLTRTVVEWEHTQGDIRYKGVSALFGAVVTEKARAEGVLRFHFPPLLIPIIKEPGRFARLRVHFLIGLSGKYAVTLYELLESVANKHDPALDVRLDTLRMWLKVPAGKLKSWDHLTSRAIYPAIAQINASPLGAGFTVEMKPIKKGRAVERVRFHVQKVDQRRALEQALQENPSPIKGGTSQSPRKAPKQAFPGFNPVRLTTRDYERAGKAAPGWDVYQLEREWREWIATKGKPDKPGAAFVAFCRKKYQSETS
jgi:hypothetical protein